MSRTSTYSPDYQLRRECPGIGKNAFAYQDVYFVPKVSLFGATESQKVALRWAASHRTPPVIRMVHERPETPDKKWFRDPQELRCSYDPYAMVTVTLECLGEKTSRKIKIYFCNVEYHESNAHRQDHSKSKGTYVVPLA
jgi:hypothetical protein